MQAGTCTYLGRAVLPHDASPNMSGDRSSMSPPSSWQPATCSNLFVADFSMTSLNQVRACRSGTYLYENLDIKRSADRVDQSVPSFLRSCVRLSALRLCDPVPFGNSQVVHRVCVPYLLRTVNRSLIYFGSKCLFSASVVQFYPGYKPSGIFSFTVSFLKIILYESHHVFFFVAF